MNTTFGKNLRAFIESNGMLQQDVADRVGVTPVALNNWLMKGVQPRKRIIDELKSAYDLTDDDLFSESNGYYAKAYGLTGTTAPKTSESFAPVVGIAAAGAPNDAWEVTGEEHWVPPHILAMDEGGFFVRIHGDSMDKELHDGSYAFVVRQQVRPAKSGDIALVKVNGDEATVKRLKLVEGLVILEPESTNPEHRRIVIDTSDPDAPEVRILGMIPWSDYQF